MEHLHIYKYIQEDPISQWLISNCLYNVSEYTEIYREVSTLFVLKPSQFRDLKPYVSRPQSR